MKRKYDQMDLEVMYRVRKGKKWLESHFDSDKFPSNLEKYEQLVAIIRSRGISEEEAWCIDPKVVEAMTTEEIEKEIEKGYN
jgi:hypothetical protein